MINNIPSNSIHCKFSRVTKEKYRLKGSGWAALEYELLPLQHLLCLQVKDNTSKTHNGNLFKIFYFILYFIYMACDSAERILRRVELNEVRVRDFCEFDFPFKLHFYDKHFILLFFIREESFHVFSCLTA